jgi:hypothetical protein
LSRLSNCRYQRRAVVRYRRLLQDTLYRAPLLTAGCLDQTTCYLPTGDMLAQGVMKWKDFGASSPSPVDSAHN